ncbi:MAG: phenylalanine--tRNA ligase subunit beta [Candidatus Rokuibacteriota bacterium]
MKIPYNWVREFVDLDLSPTEAADRLVNAGIEVASVTALAPSELAGVVIGEIQAVERELGESQGHLLRLCRVSTGRQHYAVVCGAPNARPGVRAAFAPPGAVLPGGRRIEMVTIRGVVSQGMLCSERELGVGDEHEAGILVVGGDAPLGADLVKHLDLADSLLEVEITPNRPDCLCVVGVARELAALTGRTLRAPAIAVKESEVSVGALARARIEAPDLCARFTGRVISGVRAGPSPAWMAARLRAVGLRPISNIVDVTNYVLWELGHPLHAFDYDTVTEGTIVVRRAAAGERLRTLDGVERTLTDSMLVIADPARAVAVAGVMGGAATEVGPGTTRVLLESAYFAPASIRRTARALGLATDAAYRFERGADIEALVDASARAAQLMAEVAGGSIARGLVDVYPAPQPRPRVRVRMARVQRVLGVAPPRADALRILRGLGLPATEHADEVEVEVPSFRRDVTMEDDLVEEIIRVWGYDKIPSTPPTGAIQLVSQPESVRQEAAVRRALVGAGLTEVITYSFADPDLAATLPALDGAEPMRLLNPLGQDASLMRRHPLEGTLGAVALNLRRQQPNLGLFEIGRTYGRTEGAIREARWAVVALTGLRERRGWGPGVERVDVYDAKGLAEHVLATLRFTVDALRAVPVAGLEPDTAGALVVGGVEAAIFGEVALTARARFGIDAPVFAVLVPLDALARLPAPVVRYEPLPRYPSVARDVAFLIGAAGEPTAAAIEAAMAGEAGPLLREMTLFDVFRFPDGRRSLAWRLVFQASDRTLTDDEVNAIHARVVRRVCDEFHISLRGV